MSPRLRQCHKKAITFIWAIVIAPSACLRSMKKKINALPPARLRETHDYRRQSYANAQGIDVS